LEDHSNLENKDGIVPGVEQSEPKFMASMPDTPLNPAALKFHLNRLISKTSPQAKNSISDVQQGIIAPSYVPYQ